MIKKIYTPLATAEKFSKHFRKIYKATVKKVKSSNLFNFCQYLYNCVCSSLFLICCIINHLNINKSCGSDRINAKFIVLALASDVLFPM